MRQVLIKRVEKFTLDEFKEFCQRTNTNYESVKDFFRTWAIQEKERLLTLLINSNRDEIVKVTGLIELGDGTYSIKPRILHLTYAFEKALTPDLFDWEIEFDTKTQSYTVVGYHDESRTNIFSMKPI